MAQPALNLYRTKRDFAKTAELSGEYRVAPSPRLRFDVQKHAAQPLLSISLFCGNNFNSFRQSLVAT